MSVADRLKALFGAKPDAPADGAEVRDTPPQEAAARPAEASATGPDPAEARDADYLDVDVNEPTPDAATCRLDFSRAVGPEGTALFEIPQEATDWPVIHALLGIAGVHSVISKSTSLVIARHERSTWPEILSQVEGAIRVAVGGEPAVDPSMAPPAQIQPGVALAGEDLRARIETVIEEEINPAVAAHGGYIELLDVQDSRVFIYMGGGCQGCAMSTATLKHGVETTLRQRVPEVSEVLDTTDHAAGANPFYQG